MRRSGSRRSVISVLGVFFVLSATFALVAGGTASAASTDEVAPSATAGTQEKATATLQIIEDGVSVQRAGKDVFKPGKEGQKLRVGDTVQTDATGFAQVNYTDDSFTRLDVNTTFTIVSLTDDEGNRQIKGSVDSGQTWNRTSALTEGESFEQEGAGATAAVTGTAFLVSCTSPTSCTFTSVVDGITLTTIDGEIQHLDPLMECNADEIVADEDANLCGAPRQVTLDAILANAFILENLFIDGVMGFEGVVEVQGEVVTVTPNSSSGGDDTPPPSGPPAGGPTGPSTGPCGEPVTDPAIHFDGSTGTGPPPSTLGGCEMTAFADDTRSDFSSVSSVAAPSGGDITFSAPVEKRDVTDSWATWSNGYTGDVYYTNGATTITITLPAGTVAFSFYAESNSFGPHNFTATANDGTTSNAISVEGNAGAYYFGFYTTSSDAPLTSITVTCADNDFSIGEFTISNPNPAPSFLTAPPAAVEPEQAAVAEEPPASDPPPDDPPAPEPAPAPEAAPQDAPAAP